MSWLEPTEILAMVLGDDFTHRALRLEGNDIIFDYDAPLEPEPKPDPNYVPIVGRAATQIGPNEWHFIPPTLGDTWTAKNLAKIDHIVVVMMENRSFDHVLGYRAALAGAPAQDGLTPELIEFLQSKGFSLAPLSDVDRVPPNAIGLRTAFPRAVGHRFNDVAQQLGQTIVMPDGRRINSPQGFMDNFGDKEGMNATDVLGFYAANDLPFSAFLAEQYAYSDHYFSSHPGPTLPNRMLTLSGDVQHDRTGVPILDNNRFEDDNVALSRATTIFDLLTRLGVSWRVYESFPSVTMLRLFARYVTDVTNIVDIARFGADVAAGNLPALTVVEPSMHHFPQCDDRASGHKPPVDMYRGQMFLKGIYDALRATPLVWGKTLLLITYDEHGGFYDHVVPLLAEARGRSSASSGVSGVANIPATVITPYGVRVPTFVVSPWVPAGKGPEIVLDHCSIMKTVLARFCPARPFLSDRVHAAQSFDAFLSATTPRLQVPAPPALKPLPTATAAGTSRIVTPPISRKQIREGEVDFHDLTGMVARVLLGR
jgi:phospholipase C